MWAFLIPASWIVSLWIEMMDFSYRHGLRCGAKRAVEPPIPVVSVGNLTYGGTNKTPFVEMLCRALRARGVSVGIVSRGYGGDGDNPDARVIERGRIEGVEADRRFVGDEPLLLSARLPDVPVAVSRDRVKGLEELKSRGIRLAVADDAFQHRRVARDVDIVLIDAACAFGSGRPIPAGILRESPSALRRAHIVVVTKVEQVDGPTLSALRRKLARFVPEDRIFDARLKVVDWVFCARSRDFRPFEGSVQGRKLMAFSAIGNPGSFIRSLEREGACVVGQRHFRDHHAYSEEDMKTLYAQRAACEAEFLVCTEKDIYNLPPSWQETGCGESPPLLVPRVATVLEEPERFVRVLVEYLRPHIVVASNGYGEDAIGVLLAKKLRDAFPEAEVLAFPLVGRGEPYGSQGFPVVSAPSVTPSGGVLKYRLRDLWGDIRAGLLGHIRAQQRAWRRIARRVRTPLCVGDVYLLLHTLWGQGVAPLFVATAKTVYLSGHWRLERFLIRRHCRRTWTRDQGSADQLTASGADALYAGSPIMDLLGDVVPSNASFSSKPFFPARPKVLLLPGSRARAYDDVKLLLSAAERLRASMACDYVMVLAPTLSLSRLVDACEGWRLDGELDAEFDGELDWELDGKNEGLTKGGIRIRLHSGDVSTAAAGASLLLGFGGTANQLCAGMGIPVVSIDEKGKRVQKKLLGDAEILAEPTPSALADCALRILTTPELYEKMASAGRARMGDPGALDDVVRCAAEELGWSVRCEVYKELERSLRSSG
ncbi:MAG: tetraacyldisaccharide 4'-kinase [Synergistaceae bacterium]|nr:tetraacyldisaccharide 4'-kinase [Synergistaceae bacterium]